MKHYSKNNTKDRIDAALQNELDPGFARRARLILEHIEVKPRMKILEVGCGRGFYEQAIMVVYPDCTIVSVDLNEKYLEVARKTVSDKRVRFLKADATALPFPNASFDRVICTEVLEHIHDDLAVTKEIRRVLKPGGISLITVPHARYPFLWDPLNFTLETLFGVHVPSHIWWLAGIWADHVRLYTEKEIVSVIERGGLTITKKWHATRYCFPFAHFLLYGIGKNLVESGILSGGFNRFSYDRKQSPLVKFARAPFFLVDRLNDSDQGGGRFLNFVIKAKK